jgi:hypothetical protein
MNNLYTIEKIRQLESELKTRNQLPPDGEKPRRKPIFGPLASGAGRTLRKVGERLESWANPPLPECEQQVRRDTA